MGRMSHVWLATPIQSAPGEGIVAFDDGDRLIEGLTHWLDPFAAPEAQIDTGVREGLGQAIDLVREARDSIGAGALAETAEHERSVVSPYLDGIEDELRDKYNAAPEAQEPACAECDGSGAQLTEGAITQRAIDILMGLGMDNAPNDYPKLARLLAKLLKKPALAAAGGRELPDVLFDGHAVYSTLDDRAKYRTSPENVSDVLDAVVRLIRAASQPAQEWGDE